MSLILNGMLLGNQQRRWETVAPPSSDFDWLPFDIQRDGNIFRPDPSFDLSTYADQYFPDGQTYYVSPSGADGNTGLSWDQAFRNVYTATAKTDARIVYIGAGYYYRNQCAGSSVRPEKIIGIGNVFLTSDEYNQTGAWVSTGSHYVTAFSRTIRQAYDKTNLDVFGDYGKMTLQPNNAGVDANPNSWYLDDPNNKLYIRTFDDRVPDSNLFLNSSTSAGPQLYNVSGTSLYMENLKMYGGDMVCGAVPNGAGGNLRLYIKDSEVKYSCSISSTFNALSIWGTLESILWNVKVAGGIAFDGINYKRDTTTPKFIEYNVESYNNGSGTTNQPSTSHDGSIGVRIMGKYHDCPGITGLADVGGAVPNVGRIWNLGCEIYNPTNPVTAGAVYVDTGVWSWNDRCYLHDLGALAKDLYVADVNSRIYYRNLR